MRVLLTVFLFFCSLAIGAQNMATPKSECEKLMSMALPFAEQMLQKHGEFFPYGAILKESGEVTSVAGYDGQERPPSMNIIQLLKGGFLAGAKSGEYRATALVYDVRVLLPGTDIKSDAIAVSLNHRENYSVIVIFPYQLSNGHLTFGEVFAQKGESDIFSTQ